MKKALLIIAFILSMAIPTMSQSTPVKVREIDGSPSTPSAREIIFPNGSLMIANGRVTVTFNGGGGGAGNPGGLNTQFQYNASGVFGGITTATSDGTINTFKAGVDFLFADPTDATKKAQFDLTNIATGTTRPINIPNASSTTVQTKAAVANQFLTAMSAQGLLSSAQPAFSDLSGTATKGQLPASTVFNDQVNIYVAGNKQTFQNSASTAGFNLASSADPSTPAQGDVWINGSNLKWRGASASFTAVDTSRQIINGTGISGGGDFSADRTLSVVADSVTERIDVLKDGIAVGTRKGINYITGSNTTLTVTDNAGSNRIDVTVASSASAGSRWDQLTNPSGNLSLSHGANTTAFTWGAATGASVDMFTLTDTLNNTGTGDILMVFTASGSAARPITITAQGTSNGVQMGTDGKLAPIGTGKISARSLDLTGTLFTLNAGTNFGITTPGAVSPASTITIGATTDNLRFNGLGLNVAAPTSGGQITSTLGANNITGLLFKRNTDTSPTGKFFDFQNAAGTSLATIDILGNLTVVSCTGCGGGVTNSAGVNVITKSDGTNIVASTLTDDGTTVTSAATGGIVPSTNNTKNLGSTTAKWAAGYINQIFFNPPSLANGDRIAYAAGTGPFFSDDTTGFNLSFNVQSLTLTRTVTWPNASGTIFYNSRTINTTSPITGGGDLSADRTIACATCTTNAAALTANLPVIGAGSNAIAVGTRSGNTTQFVTTTGTLTSGDCVKIDASGNFIANGSACGGSGSVANPTATIGLTAVNGVASSAIRSDGAPALSQSIAPTWTGQHIWSLSNAAAVSIGPNGDTNPALRLVTNVASAATGFSVTGNAAGSGATLTVLSSGTNEDAIINPKGSGALSVGGSGSATIKPTDASGTNIAGSDQIIIQGLGTGNASPGLYRVQGGALSTSSGTTLQTAIDRHVVGRPFVLANNTATTVINVTNTSGSAAAVVIDYAVEITNGTDYQVEEGQISCHVTNKAGTIANNTCTKYGNQQAATAGTLTVTWTITAANPALVQINANSSLTPSTGFPRLVYSVKNLTNQAIAAQ